MSGVVDYPALRRARLRGGVGARSATLIWGVAGMAAFSIGLPWGALTVLLGAVAHAGLRWFFAQDHRIFQLYMVHEIVPNNLHAGFPCHGEPGVSRPSGFARSLPIQ